MAIGMDQVVCFVGTPELVARTALALGIFLGGLALVHPRACVDQRAPLGASLRGLRSPTVECRNNGESFQTPERWPQDLGKIPPFPLEQLEKNDTSATVATDCAGPLHVWQQSTTRRVSGCIE